MADSQQRRAEGQWTVETVKEKLEGELAALKELTEQKFHGQERATEAALRTSQLAIDKAEISAKNELMLLGLRVDVVEKWQAERGGISKQAEKASNFNWQLVTSTLALFVAAASMAALFLRR